MVTSDSTAQRFEPRIVFASNRDGDWDIYSMEVNGNNLVQLTDHPASDEFPACSPDGRRIAFISERHGPPNLPNLYVMDRDGNNVIRLTNSDSREGRASWSPDGTKIAFSSFCEINCDIFTVDADGDNLTRLAEDETHDARPSWSRDGSKIAFDSRRLFGCDHIYVMTAEGKKLEQLTEEGDNTSPVYVRDGTKIAFVSHRDGDYNIYLMDNNGKNSVKLTRTPPGIDNDHPSWSHGGLAVNPSGKLPISWGELKRTRNP
jgi:Tol biopolymer transport system component